MKKILIGLVVVMLMASIPLGVGAEDCCQYEGCCRDMCCAEQTFDFKVRYFERVESGFFTPWGTPMWTGVWTMVIVEAHDRDEAADSLGLRAGYDCWVTKVV